jgi:ankyrin repeat protein
LAASAYAQTTGFFDLARIGIPQQIQAAINNGADVNATDKYGMTPLMWAAEYNRNPEVITTLLKAGADLKAQDKSGFTALMIAASRTHSPEIIITLLRAGADAKAKNGKGYTALDYAKYNRYLEGTNALKELKEASKVNEKGRHQGGRRIQRVSYLKVLFHLKSATTGIVDRDKLSDRFHCSFLQNV